MNIHLQIIRLQRVKWAEIDLFSTLPEYKDIIIHNVRKYNLCSSETAYYTGGSKTNGIAGTDIYCIKKKDMTCHGA